MTTEEKTQVIEALSVLAESCNRDVSRALLVTYAQELGRLPVAVVLGAIHEALTRERFFPSLAELLTLCGAGKADPDHDQIEQMIVATLRGLPISHGEFVGLVVERLGGWRITEEMPFVVRTGKIRSMLPNLLVAARARGVEIPDASVPPVALPAPPRAALEDGTMQAVIARIGKSIP
jgi:hypothetical protein